MTEGLRGSARRLLGGPVGAGLVAALDRSLPRRRGDLAVLTYHRVDEPDAHPELLPSLLSATPAAFADQMAMLARHYRPVALAEVIDALDRPARLPERAVLVTFDDGYRDLAEHAWPIMRRASIPATLFVATGGSDAPGRPFWWDRLWGALSRTDRIGLDTPVGPLDLTGPPARLAAMRRIRSWLKELDHDVAMDRVDELVAELAVPLAETAPPSLLDWDALRALAREGLTLAPHTRSHPLLDRVPLERAVAEIRASHDDLTREIGSISSIPPAFAYPSGAHGGDAVDAARRAGMRLAFTTERGGNDLRRADPLRLRRINVGRHTPTPMVRAQLAWATTVDARRSRGD